MQWLAEIFESPSDQARLVTTIIAATIAIAVVLLNQWFNSRRARKEKLVGKVEEIYSVVIKMQLLKSNIHHEVITGYNEKPKLAISYGPGLNEKERRAEWQRKLDEMRDEFSALGAEAYMLTGLYFPLLSKYIGEMWSTFDDLFGSYIKSKTLEEYMVNSTEHYDKINGMFLTIFEILSKIMKKTMH